MLPVLRWEVEEGEQRVGVLLQRRDGLRILGPVLAGEPRDRLARLLPRFGVHRLWSQPRCSRVFGHTSRTAVQNPRAPSPTATTGARMPRRFRSRSTVFQLSALSRWPSSTAINSFVPSARTPIITSVQRRSSSSGTLKWTPSTHTYT